MMLWGDLQSFIQLVIAVHAGYALFSEAGSRALKKNERDINGVKRLAQKMLDITNAGNQLDDRDTVAKLMLEVLSLYSKNSDYKALYAHIVQWTRVLATLVCFLFAGLLIYASFNMRSPLDEWLAWSIIIAGSVIATGAVMFHSWLTVVSRHGLSRKLATLRDIHLSSLPSFPAAVDRLRNASQD